LIADGTIDLQVRTGLNTGMIVVGKTGLKVLRRGSHPDERVIVGDKLGGNAVVLGARIASVAKAGEVLVSATVKDFVAGPGITFESRGAHALEGIAGQCVLFAVTAESVS
jgi:class 3 adenylate cyclase